MVVLCSFLCQDLRHSCLQCQSSLLRTASSRSCSQPKQKIAFAMAVKFNSYDIWLHVHNPGREFCRISLARRASFLGRACTERNSQLHHSMFGLISCILCSARCVCVCPPHLPMTLQADKWTRPIRLKFWPPLFLCVDNI